ncbi:ankyrin repeat protein [Mollivirus sibericum]|uniref:ankyrin repeat protein n=1 Tax=Mollivirus sibericum TaxID=1678078 RepID=UPI0006B2E440|nr:ankyrin repeat protein [Mollivirus sibericum]ALD62022.1 ankyrin repeat protein [Mollivirus sibericum]
MSSRLTKDKSGDVKMSDSKQCMEPSDLFRHFAGLDSESDTSLGELKALLARPDVLASINSTNSDDESVLYIAVDERLYQSARALVEAGADPFGTHAGDSPLHTLVCSSSVHSYQFARWLFEWLTKAGKVRETTTCLNWPDATWLKMITWKRPKYRDMFKLVIENGADPNKTNSHGASPLHLAARSNDTDLARILLKKGADVNAVMTQERNATPLHFAAWRNYDHMAFLLLSHGASRDAVTTDGSTPYQASLLSIKPDGDDDQYDTATIIKNWDRWRGPL